MPRLTETDGLTDLQQDILRVVREFTDAEILPVASEYAKEVVEDALRIHGGYGYSQEFEIERLYRDVQMLLIGEGTAEIQKMIIGRRLLDQFAVV
jgi:hypothetical protein